MSIVVKTDFTAEFKVAKNCFDELDTYISTYEQFYLVKLLGAELYKLFDADLTGSPQVPQATRFENIFNAFQEDDNSCVFESEGIRKMLTQFIYFHYTRDNQHEQTVAGTVKPKSQIAEHTPYKGYNLVEAYNKAVRNYKSIQWYICENEEDYSEENMQPLDFISGI